MPAKKKKSKKKKKGRKGRKAEDKINIYEEHPFEDPKFCTPRIKLSIRLTQPVTDFLGELLMLIYYGSI